jgi:hypothetical protein
MNEAFLISIAIRFAVRQIAKFGKQVDKEKIKADLKPRLEKLIPGVQLDQAAVIVMNSVIDGIFDFLSSADVLAAIVSKLLEGKIDEVIQEIAKYLEANVRIPALAIA